MAQSTGKYLRFDHINTGPNEHRHRHVFTVYEQALSCCDATEHDKHMTVLPVTTEAADIVCWLVAVGCG